MSSGPAASLRIASGHGVRRMPQGGADFAALNRTAQLGVTVTTMPVRDAVEIEHAISAFAAEPNGASPGPILDAIGRLAPYHHLPLMLGGAVVNAGREGVLMAHGPDLSDLTRRTSSYGDRILRGARPTELPIQYPTKFELVVNLKTAKVEPLRNGAI